MLVDVLDDLRDSGTVAGFRMLRRDLLEIAVADETHVLEPLQRRHHALASQRVAAEHDHLAIELLREDFHDALDPDGRAVDEVESDAGVDQDLHGSLLDFARNVCDISLSRESIPRMQGTPLPSRGTGTRSQCGPFGRHAHGGGAEGRCIHGLRQRDA